MVIAFFARSFAVYVRPIHISYQMLNADLMTIGWRSEWKPVSPDGDGATIGRARERERKTFERKKNRGEKRREKLPLINIGAFCAAIKGNSHDNANNGS